MKPINPLPTFPMLYLGNRSHSHSLTPQRAHLEPDAARGKGERRMSRFPGVLDQLIAQGLGVTVMTGQLRDPQEPHARGEALLAGRGVARGETEGSQRILERVQGGERRQTSHVQMLADLTTGDKSYRSRADVRRPMFLLATPLSTLPPPIFER